MLLPQLLKCFNVSGNRETLRYDRAYKVVR
jgi:hypothetical protein